MNLKSSGYCKPDFFSPKVEKEKFSDPLPGLGISQVYRLGAFHMQVLKCKKELSVDTVGLQWEGMKDSIGLFGANGMA
ncbi:hypothetical protein E5288_WYG000789 [Bos mutus]|uniref:Uncharacterized protein n=1 Tax=Bos mutus TaxID=72004 RepID=A0A6B0RK83_9CETA|nr:hypothetical protein [Bos mutus]